MATKSQPAVDAGQEGASGGSTGGASQSELQQGYIDCNKHRDYEPGLAPEPFYAEIPHGFLDRPQGWDR